MTSRPFQRAASRPAIAKSSTRSSTNSQKRRTSALATSMPPAARKNRFSSGILAMSALLVAYRVVARVLVLLLDLDLSPLLPGPHLRYPQCKHPVVHRGLDVVAVDLLRQHDLISELTPGTGAPAEQAAALLSLTAHRSPLSAGRPCSCSTLRGVSNRRVDAGLCRLCGRQQPIQRRREQLVLDLQVPYLPPRPVLIGRAIVDPRGLVSVLRTHPHSDRRRCTRWFGSRLGPCAGECPDFGTAFGSDCGGRCTVMQWWVAAAQVQMIFLRDIRHSGPPDQASMVAGKLADFARLPRTPLGTAQWVQQHFTGTNVATRAITAGSGQLMHSKYIVPRRRQALPHRGGVDRVDELHRRRLDFAGEQHPHRHLRDARPGLPARFHRPVERRRDHRHRHEPGRAQARRARRPRAGISPPATAPRSTPRSPTRSPLERADHDRGDGAHLPHHARRARRRAERGMPITGIYDSGQMARSRKNGRPAPTRPAPPPWRTGPGSRRCCRRRNPPPTPRTGRTTSCTTRS